MLRAAIEARYGINPPVIEQLRIFYKGQTRVKLGPIKTLVPMEATASFIFPTHLRWDTTMKPANLSVQRSVETFDGKVYRTQRTYKSPTEKSSANIVQSARGRLWQTAASLLTPLSDHFIYLSQCGEHCLSAMNGMFNDSVNIQLRENATVESITIRCFNPDEGKDQTSILRLSEEQILVDNLMLPAQISAYWDDELYYQISPISVNINPELAPSIFSLDDKTFTV
jgi:hypothetical protein